MTEKPPAPPLSQLELEQLAGRRALERRTQLPIRIEAPSPPAHKELDGQVAASVPAKQAPVPELASAPTEPPKPNSGESAPEAAAALDPILTEPPELVEPSDGEDGLPSSIACLQNLEVDKKPNGDPKSMDWRAPAKLPVSPDIVTKDSGSAANGQPSIFDTPYGKHILYRDWETYSEADIEEGGALHYAMHPSTVPLLVCYAVDDGPVHGYRPGSGEPIPEVFFTAADDPNWSIAAHHNLFDSAIEIHQAAPRFNWPLVPIERQVCSMALAQYHGYPGALEKIAERLALPLRKDKDGKKLMRRLTRPQRRPDGTWGYIEPTPDEWERFINYCKIDTALIRPVLHHFPPLPESERQLYRLDQKINHHGFTADVALATQTCELVKTEKAYINARLAEITDGKVMAFTRLKAIAAFVRERGYDMIEVNKHAVAAVLARHPDPIVREVLELRPGRREFRDGEV